MKPSHPQNRPEERFAVDFPVYISWQQGNLLRRVNGRCVDLSASGARVETTEPLPVHTMVVVNSEKFGRMGNATVRYCTRDRLKYSIGLLFGAALALGDPVRRKILATVLRPDSDHKDAAAAATATGD